MVKMKKLLPRCFFDITIGGVPAGRIIFELYNEICPKTCKNFISLCTGECDLGKSTGKPLHYRNCRFHRVIKNFIIQSGDFTHGNGKGGESIYGLRFEDESFHYKHERPFLLSMANRGKNTNGSQFFITMAPAPHLDGTHVVFGHVLFGQDVVLKIAEQPVDKNNRPTVEVVISNCGELVPQFKPKEKTNESEEEESESSSDSDSDSSSSLSSNSDSDSNREKEKLTTNSVGAEDDSKKSDQKEEQNEQEYDDNPFFKPKYCVKINCEDIPEVPKNRFLARNVVKNDDAKNYDRERRPFRNNSGYDRSGRVVKGRGSIRYRTPSPQGDRQQRSDTPPHWRVEQAKLRTLKEVLSGDQKNAQRKSGHFDDRKQRRRPSWDVYEDRRNRYGHPRHENRNRNSSFQHRESAYPRWKVHRDAEDLSSRFVSGERASSVNEMKRTNKKTVRSSHSHHRHHDDDNGGSYGSDGDRARPTTLSFRSRSPSLTRHSNKKQKRRKHDY